MRYVAVVKADAYGHGMPQMVRRLMQSGVDYFAVANVHEAADIRHMGKGWPILILSPVLPEEDQFLVDYDLIGTVSTPEEAMRFNTLGASRAVQIKVHFSSADSEREFTRIQRQRLLTILDNINTTDLLIHADNSASLNTLSGDSPFNAVRIGLLQFGVRPYPNSLLGNVDVEPVFSFHTRVGIVKDLPKGTDISYGRTCSLQRDTRIAVLTAGYADGIPLKLSNTGSVLLHGQHCPILGRVTMDQTIIDVSDLDQTINLGDHVVLIGTSQTAEITASDFSDLAETIPWEVLCSITKRVVRIYIGSREL